MPDWGNCSRWPVLPVFKTSLALEKILLPSSKTTESGVVCFFVVWRSVVMTTAFKIKVAQRFFFSQLATLVIYYNFLKLATFQLGVAQGVIILTRRCLSFISSSVKNLRRQNLILIQSWLSCCILQATLWSLT